MLLPIRCYTCGKVLGNLARVWEFYRDQHGDKDWLPFFQKYNIQRYCCKRVLLSQVPDPNHNKHHAPPPSVALSQENTTNMFLAR